MQSVAASLHGDGDDVHRGGRHVAVRAEVAGGHGLDFLEHVEALGDLAEDAVAEALRRGAAEVEEAVVRHVDEELAGGAVHVGGARHGQRALRVLEAVGRLVADRPARRLLLHVAREAAALDHEVGDDAVEDRAVVVAVFDVLEKVLHRLRGLVRIEFRLHLAEAGLDRDHVRFSWFHGHGARGGLLFLVGRRGAGRERKVSKIKRSPI